MQSSMTNEKTIDNRPLKVRLVEWRARREFTQAEAAAHFGAALSTYQHWEQPNQSEPRGTARLMVEKEISQ